MDSEAAAPGFESSSARLRRNSSADSGGVTLTGAQPASGMLPSAASTIRHGVLYRALSEQERSWDTPEA